jgi:hypothetical protein
MMTTVKMTLARRHLDEAIANFGAILKDCDLDELMGAKTIAQMLADARGRMSVLLLRMRNRMEGEV